MQEKDGVEKAIAASTDYRLDTVLKVICITTKQRNVSGKNLPKI